ncbi:CCA tRNA nucleotidyltransferase [Acidiphilium sp. AL]|uniref:CCA tRNA nucleotidyltransferase n=1 Tax=Acidiphilium iwatense TaxID=768198 RepID=A0ABS9E0P9_9PROT|nr:MULTISPECIES: CCA tRNA nucleotidyltransferase [Acidiphilium]MCF3948577.1 CCA tRNA nucleotidyltransferase [Acidiphilium iwatense]MCU4161953.1 CCA tRNA nucleotidyltransferase [Acidiphilium sp. AL]
MNDPRLEILWNALPEARIVGGAVRDILAGRECADIDLAVPLEPEAVAQRLAQAGIRAIPTGLDHGTITALIDGRSFEITTLRHDVATDGRRATVSFTDDWRADAARRDFTINAMSMDRAGTVFDCFGGRADLATGIVRFVGVAAVRIAEDYLRILRFFRFFARYGRGQPDAAAIAAITELRKGLARLSAERVWQELKQILTTPDPRTALRLMVQTGVLGIVLPESAALSRFEAVLSREAPPDPILRLAALIETDGAGLAERLRLSEAERTRLAALRIAPDLPPDIEIGALRRALADTEPDILTGRTWLTPDDADRTSLRARLAATPRPIFPLKGRDALALGAEPGPPVGEALAAARAWWLARDCEPDAEACRVELARNLHSGR